MTSATEKSEDAAKGIFDDVYSERIRQLQKWGEQSYGDGTSSTEATRDACDRQRKDCDRLNAEGRITWIDILGEEVLEALVEVEWPKLRAELVQIAAVVFAWIEDGDKRVAA